MKKITVYLIDDEPGMLEIMKETVEMVGFGVKSYTRAALFFEQNPVLAEGAILVLDLNMPEMDGIEVMRRLSKQKNPPKIILITGYDQGVLHAAEKLGKARSLDIIDTISKPLPIERLKALLEEQAMKIIEKGHQAPSGLGDTFSVGEFHSAITHGQLVLHYQPQLDIATGVFTGVEALVRWQHPEKGLIFPDSFIPIAEQNGLMGQLTNQVIDMAVEQHQAWQKDGISIAVSVNISAVNITSLTLPEQLAGLLESRQLDPGMITLEVTESALMGELVTSLDILTRMRLKGIRLSIDDFGTGYSSLSQLHRVPFTELKIDRSFVMNMVKDDQARAIVKTCIMLGHELDMIVVAEGVETKEHIKLLTEMGCDIGQGYYICRPAPPETLNEMLHKGRFEIDEH